MKWAWSTHASSALERKNCMKFTWSLVVLNLWLLVLNLILAVPFLCQVQKSLSLLMYNDLQIFSPPPVENTVSPPPQFPGLQVFRHALSLINRLFHILFPLQLYWGQGISDLLIWISKHSRDLQLTPSPATLLWPLPLDIWRSKSPAAIENSKKLSLALQEWKSTCVQNATEISERKE